MSFKTRHLTIKKNNDFIGVCMSNPELGVNGWTYCDENGEPKEIDKGTYFDSHPLFQVSTELIDGQHMIKFPKGYAKAGTNTSGQYYIGVSSKMFSGSAVHPAFYNYNTGAEINQFWMGKYEGSLSNDKVCSVPNVAPYVNVTGNVFETKCANRGTDWHNKNIWETLWISTLLLIKACNGDCQTVYGRGHVDNNPSNVINTGAACNSAPALYTLGINSWWGNIWEFVSGRRGNTVLKPGAVNTYVTDGGNHTSALINNIATGIVSELGNRDKGLLVISGEGSNSTQIISDYSYYTTSASSWYWSGGAYGFGSNAGPFYFNHTGSSDYYSAYGCRIAKW
jgi:hypothetical protein